MGTKHRPLPPLVVTTADAAAMLRCTEQHLTNLADAGQIRRVNIGTSRSVRIPLVDVYRLVGLEDDEAIQRLADALAERGEA